MEMCTRSEIRDEGAICRRLSWHGLKGLLVVSSSSCLCVAGCICKPTWERLLMKLHFQPWGRAVAEKAASVTTLPHISNYVSRGNGSDSSVTDLIWQRRVMTLSLHRIWQPEWFFGREMC